MKGGRCAAERCRPKSALAHRSSMDRRLRNLYCVLRKRSVLQFYLCYAGVSQLLLLDIGQQSLA